MTKKLWHLGRKCPKAYLLFQMEKSEFNVKQKYRSLQSSQPENLVTAKKCQVLRFGRVGGRTTEGTSHKGNLYKIIMELRVNFLNEL